MKNTYRFLPALVGVTLSSALNAQSGAHPNVIYVFPDQFRNCAMQFWNEKEFTRYINFKADPVHTPVLDKFAREAVVLS